MPIRLQSHPLAPNPFEPTATRPAVGRLSGLLIQALRYLGQGSITPEVLEFLRNTLPARERLALVRHLKLAPAWMHRYIRAIAAVDPAVPRAI